MKGNTIRIYRILTVLLLLGLSGCERTTQDIVKWEAQEKVTKLIRALRDDNWRVCAEAARALGHLKAKQAIDPLAEQFTNPHSKVAINSVEALVSIGGQSAEERLINALELENLKACLAAANGLGTLKSVRAIDPLAKAMSGVDERVATAAATSLGLINDEKAIPALIIKMKSRWLSLRLACLKSLVSIGGPNATEGIVLALGDISETVRQTAENALLEIGKPAIPYALAGLRANESVSRLSAVAVLKGTDAVPTEGTELAWYRLAQVPSFKKVGIDREKTDQLAGMGNAAVDALLEGVAHESLDIREHAFFALESIGESCLLQVIEAAETKASPNGKHWYAGRTSWAGAPAWQLDLWGSAAVLSPNFKLISGYASDKLVYRVLTLSKSHPRREYVPLLITLLTPLDTETKKTKIDFFGVNTPDTPPKKSTAGLFGADSIKVVEEYREAAMQRLVIAGHMATLPLIAAIEDSDQQISESSAEVLGDIGDSRAVAPLAGMLSRKITKGEELTQSPFYLTLQKLNDPSTEALLRKVRPNETHANRSFEQQYPGITITYTRTKNARAGYDQPIGFLIGYIQNEETGELRIAFKKNSAGEWLPTPPLPAKLP